ncbi:hypothetical protein HOS46_gp19 [Escherichia phage DTL]|uniref:Uncharacterized protein n=1 Tax=Escherichia phage DTL TaxID=2048061 RepID=A0A2H4PGM8_9CAUD|nr:hypothetical protein HOS46_gp19 [Escherichia phage DTL]ATW61796.1 hypothetical protein [Escherichia phage DTL]
MITINLSDKQAATLKQLLASQTMQRSADEYYEMVKEVRTQINNQQFDVSDFESSRQYESLSVNAAYLTNWDKATKK